MKHEKSLPRKPQKSAKMNDYTEEEPTTSSQSQNIEEKTPRFCLVCTDKSDGTHFGIDSCRACAAFFRRSVIGAKKYTCRLGKNGCMISKTIKSMCRRCRLMKCLSSGMKPEYVREPLPPKTLNRSSEFFSSTTLETDELLSAFKRVKAVAIPPEPQPSAPPKLLQTIADNYKQLCSIRRATEMAMEKDSAKTIFSTDQVLNGMSFGNLAKMSVYYRAHIHATADFVSNSFPEFQALEQSEKWILFHPFVIHFWSLDNAYRSWCLIPEEFLHKYCIVSETIYMDIDRAEEFFPNLLKIEKKKEESSRLIRSLLGRPRVSLVKAVQKLAPDPIEYAAVLAIILFTRSVEKGEDSTDDLGESMRKQIFDALHYYYIGQGITNYSLKMCAINNVLSLAVQFANMMKEFTEIFNMLDLYEGNSFIHDFIKKK